MRVLILCESVKQCEVVESNAVPRIGERVAMYYSPAPTVKSVLWWPSKEMQTNMGIRVTVDVIVEVE